MKGKSSLVKSILMMLVLVCGLCCCKISAEAATSMQKQQFREELKKMLYSADASVHNVKGYKLTVSEFNSIYEDMKNGDCQLIIASYYSNMRVEYTKNWFWIDTIQLTNVDSDVLPRYERLKNNVGKILSGIEEDMTKLDKIIYLHDALVDLVNYKFIAYQSYGACGALGDSEAVCAGYTKALNMLLEMQGIEAYFAESKTINHGWTYVNLDGEWYHIDPTWDDTRSAVRGTPSHRFMLRNDKEFTEGGSNSHVEWVIDETSKKSLSTRFSDWYVHDITGKMSFEDGYWYYVNVADNSIERADALGNNMTVVLDGKNLDKLTMVDVEDGKITYKKGNQTVTEELEHVGKNVMAEKQENTTGSNIATDNVGTDNVVSTDTISADAVTYDFNDINHWREGQYALSDGKYTEAAGYICTKELIACKNVATLGIAMKDNRFHGVVTQYAEDGKFINATDVVNGDELHIDDNCTFIGVSIYFPNWKTIPFSEYSTKFTYNLMTFEVVVLDWKESAEVKEVLSDKTNASGNIKVDVLGSIAEVNLNNIANWRVGGYDSNTGEYTSLEGYISTQKYVEVIENRSYTISMKDTRFHAVICEYRADGSYIISNDMVNGNEWIPNEDTAYIGVNIYFPMWKAISFAEYTTKFTYNLMTLNIL